MVAYSGSLDERGKARHFYGGYIQGTYDFGQGTNIGYSYGSNHLVGTGQDDGEDQPTLYTWWWRYC